MHVSYCDVAGSLPQAQPALWDDGLHFSKQGYDELGVLVARHMATLMHMLEQGAMETKKMARVEAEMEVAESAAGLEPVTVAVNTECTHG